MIISSCFKKSVGIPQYKFRITSTYIGDYKQRELITVRTIQIKKNQSLITLLKFNE